MKGVGVVAALSMEARTLGPAVRRADGLCCVAGGSLMVLSGMGYAAAAVGARNLVDAGACALLSFGLAGGLDPRLSAGAVVIPSEVISHGGSRFTTSRDWRENLSAAVRAHGPVVNGDLLSSLQAIDTLTAKSAAFHDTGAVAVDMESLAVAEVAAGRNLPFAALRVIVDTASDVLPSCVVAASREGQVRIGRLIGGLALAPADLVGLIRLARRYRTAVRSLAAAARATRLTQFTAAVCAA